MTKVIPMATIPVSENCRTMFSRLSRSVKCGAVSQKATKMIPATMMIPTSYVRR
jgi:hypothetical protein